MHHLLVVFQLGSVVVACHRHGENGWADVGNRGYSAWECQGHLAQERTVAGGLTRRTRQQSLKLRISVGRVSRPVNFGPSQVGPGDPTSKKTHGKRHSATSKPEVAVSRGSVAWLAIQVDIQKGCGILGGFQVGEHGDLAQGVANIEFKSLQ